MAASPGKHGFASAPEAGRTIFPFHGAVIKGVFSYPLLMKIMMMKQVLLIPD